MAKYTDPFERGTMIEFLPSFYNERVGFVIRKERQSIFESWDLATAKKISEELQTIIQMLEENDDKSNSRL